MAVIDKWKVEYARSARSGCQICKKCIKLNMLRLGKMVRSSRFDGLMARWSHGDCIMKKPNQIKSIGDIEGLESLRWEDQQKLNKYMDCEWWLNNKGDAPSMDIGIGLSPTSRATCRHCLQKILQGEVRISTKPDDPRVIVVAWHHAKCFLDLSPSTKVEDLYGWGSLQDSDQALVRTMVKDVPSTSTTNTRTPNEDKGKEILTESTTRVNGKRKRKNSGCRRSKVVKTEENRHPSTELDPKLEVQAKELWTIKDNLKKYVNTTELQEMLEINGQDSTGPESELRDCCADGMLFGVLAKCPVCSGSIRFLGGKYICHGFVSVWSKCSYSTRESERLNGEWKVPTGTNNRYLVEWFGSQKADHKSVRVLAYYQPKAVDDGLESLKVAFVGFSDNSSDSWKAEIEKTGGSVHPKTKKDTTCLVVSDEMLNRQHWDTVRAARRMKIPVVRAVYLAECFKSQKKLPCEPFIDETVGRVHDQVGHAPIFWTARLWSNPDVHPFSGLQGYGQILEDDLNIYNTTLNKSDLSTRKNSYYILQIIEDGNPNSDYLFRKWGRVGNESIGGNKLEELSRSDAIHEFKKLFHEKTGNTWESKENFRKKPGKFYPLNIDNRFSKNSRNHKSRMMKNWVNADSRLPLPVRELMGVLFDKDIYSVVMDKYKINRSEMPSGKISKINIHKGFEALSDIQGLLNDESCDLSVKEARLVDASNKFFTLIPSTKPRVIKDEDDLRSKVIMLEALQNIEIASTLVGFDSETVESLDEKYKKLHCEITPLPHDSEDYQMIEEYLNKTHAPNHTKWSLELEEVFTIEREGESDRFAPSKNLNNRMLLWHGSSVTNFVGILSQGLRIAPPEAPTSGYTFGKGIYFADMVSKSAQYCLTSRTNPVGLMLLSEVALGEPYELSRGEYMSEPPEGKHSTKGMGNMKPNEIEYVKWNDDVVVPCGKPVPSNVNYNSSLRYNEYIVYDTAQVKMQFLLKVRFRHRWN